MSSKSIEMLRRSVVLRALLYALAITTLVILLPSVDHVFVYQEF